MGIVAKQILIRLVIIAIVVILQSRLVFICTQIDEAIEFISIFIHETGHAFGSILTGGSISKITLGAHGGLAFTNGGIAQITLFGGYIMPPLIGTVLYISINHSFAKTIRVIPYVFGVYAILVGFLWVKDYTTLGLLVMICYIFRKLSLMKCSEQLKTALRFFAVYFIACGFFKSYDAYDSFDSEDDVHQMSYILGISLNDSLYIWRYSTAFLCALCIISDYISIFRQELYEDYESLKERYPEKEKPEKTTVHKPPRNKTNDKKKNNNVNSDQW